MTTEPEDFSDSLDDDIAESMRDPTYRAAYEAMHKRDAWDEAIQEAYDLGWLHDWAKSDALARNPYRSENLANPTTEES